MKYMTGEDIMLNDRVAYPDGLGFVEKIFVKHTDEARQWDDSFYEHGAIMIRFDNGGRLALWETENDEDLEFLARG